MQSAPICRCSPKCRCPNPEQRALLERPHRQDHERAQLLDAELSGDEEGVLESSKSATVRDIARRARQVAATSTRVLIHTRSSFACSSTGSSRRVLLATEGRVYGPGGAAEVLGVPPSTLQSRMKKLGLGRLPVAPTGRSR